MALLQALFLSCFVVHALSHGYPSGVHIGHFPASYPENSNKHQDDSKKPVATPEPTKPTTPEPKKPVVEDPKKSSDPQCSPSEWEGQAIGRVVIDSKPVAALMFKTNISVSHSCQMEVYDTATKLSPKKYIKTRTYRCFKAKKEFELDLETGKCKVARKITVPMKRVCKGANDVKLVRSFLVGDKMADLIETTNHGFEGTSFTTVLRESFAPVSAIATAKGDDGGNIYTALQYFNIKKGCKDKSVFQLPDACKACAGYGQKQG